MLTKANSFAITDRMVVLAKEDNRVTYWDPNDPTRFSSITFGRDWRISLHCGALLLAQNGDEHLLWHLSLKCGVRCRYEERAGQRQSRPVPFRDGVENISFYGNAFFVRTADSKSLYLVPLVGSTVTATSEPVPADLPLVACRCLYEGSINARFSEPLSNVRMYTDDPSLPPVFYRSLDEVWRFV